MDVMDDIKDVLCLVVPTETRAGCGTTGRQYEDSETARGGEGSRTAQTAAIETAQRLDRSTMADGVHGGAKAKDHAANTRSKFNRN